MPKVIKALPLVVFALALYACALPSAQPYAALYQPPNPQPTLQPTQAPTSAPTARAACEVSAIYALNLRACPGTACSVIAILYHGELLTLTGNDRGAWSEVVTPGDLVGWINSNYCNKGK